MSPADPAGDWARVADLFHRALDRPADERAAFVEVEAHGDAILAGEVQSLLQAHERAGTFIEAPAAPPAHRERLAQVAYASRDDAHVGPVDVLDQVVGHYRLLRVLGQGGMGVVYLAEDTRLGRTVALKALPPGLTREPAQRARLAREARAAAALNHPGIAMVFALEEIDGQLYIASEYVPGPTLRQELGSGAGGVRLACETMQALARALAAAHAKGIVHRDLKPENVIRAGDGTLKILDFGLARFVDGSEGAAWLTRDGAILGTPAYMAPEQIRGEQVDVRADVFALGVIAWEQATGTHPFDAGSPRQRWPGSSSTRRRASSLAGAATAMRQHMATRSPGGSSTSFVAAWPRPPTSVRATPSSWRTRSRRATVTAMVRGERPLRTRPASSRMGRCQRRAGGGASIRRRPSSRTSSCCCRSGARATSRERTGACGSSCSVCSS